MTASLEAVLAAREARAALQAELGARWNSPILSLSLVSPGPVKDDALRRRVLDRAEAALDTALTAAGQEVLEGLRLDGEAGPVALRAVRAPASAIKAVAVALEDGLPWGRILDIDVVTVPDSGLPEPLSRSALGLAPRACLLCGREARYCMGGGRHDKAALAAEAERLLTIAATS